MSERKAINKYYPPDYNPIEAEKQARKLAKKLKTKNRNVVTIRLMTPFSMKCLKCSEFIPKSRKFNGKKELIPERYLDTIKIYRLSIKCPACNNLISFKTDPKSSDYVMEIGGVRNHFSKTEEDNQKGNKTETVDEALERLLKVQKEEEQELTGENDVEDKMELLEQKLTQLQKQQQDDEELERMKKNSYIRMKQTPHIGVEQKDDSKDIIMDNEYERKAEQAFSNNNTNLNESKIDFDDPENKTFFKKNNLIKVHKKKVIKKVNPLGISIKKKK
ncbi:hypothetical protein TPHA_0C03920 [Tetrapisispora phaffii CBS 4417]|uniref:Splicing factor YJU2 n=1 Tax=Tetrapisispora phaffii (strain ATCC 24235 / CBS 4417 / NBRC 1672 / NRRL Y-8282 / UCD 70-5) TaxID=1071381 RepID=G8BQN0_TETPH|nr:hypothetical protein TPHA_0C03920 [Tetrapisispora phaffii CBS 4417]CCE62542.1 hypothetical protein TPHA_0C03920 [Tetrapisispora phaffii CBS 4417]